MGLIIPGDWTGDWYQVAILSERPSAIADEEVVATLMDEPPEDCPEEVEAWVEERSAPSASMISNARYATEVVRDDSQLKDLWKDSDGFEDWQASVGELLARLLG